VVGALALMACASSNIGDLQQRDKFHMSAQPPVTFSDRPCVLAFVARLVYGLLLVAVAWGFGAHAQGSDSPQVAPDRRVALSDAERAYLAQKGDIKMCVQPDWLPYERINEKGQHEGIGAEMIALMQERLGIKVVLYPTKEWAASVAAIRARECDILSMSANVPSRRDVMNFTQPYIVQPLVIATQAREIFIKDGSEIGNRKIGIIKGYVFVAMLRSRYPGIQITEVAGTADGLERVRKGELWGYIDTMPTIAYSLQKYSMQDLKISGKLDFTLDLCVTSRNDEPMLGTIMQKATDAISEEERRAIINKWISVRVEHGVDYALIWKLGAGMSVLLLGFYIWNRKLAKFNRAIGEKNVLIEQQHQMVVHTLERVAALLNNAGQGFLSFGADLRVASEFSQACVVLLGVAPGGCAADELLFPQDRTGRKLMRDCIADALAETDSLRRSMFLSLIPSELRLNDRVLKAEFIAIDTGIMTVLSDVTAQSLLEQKVVQETRRMEMILAAVTDGPDFFATVDEFRTFAVTGGQAWDRLADADLYRAIHTFKGSFNQLGFYHLPKALHSVETQLQAMLGATDGNAKPGHDEVIEMVFAHPWLALLEQDLSTINETLGEDFLRRRGVVTLSPEQAKRFERLAGEFLKMPHLNEQHRLAATELALLRSISLSKELSEYDRLVQQIAKRLDKEVTPLVVERADVRIDPDAFGPFLRSLGHVFRNAVDHGIEDPETRYAAGKSEAGTIACRVSRVDGTVVLEISDDGAGIDEVTLRRRAASLKVGNTADWSREDLVFADGLSCRDNATELSGRGVGMAAVRAEVVRLGGSVQVQSSAARGTRFTFSIPLTHSERIAA
jgi:signal transduction histidine kinase